MDPHQNLDPRPLHTVLDVLKEYDEASMRSSAISKKRRSLGSFKKEHKKHEFMDEKSNSFSRSVSLVNSVLWRTMMQLSLL